MKRGFLPYYMWNSNEFSIAPILSSYDIIKDTFLAAIFSPISWYNNKRMNYRLFP
jgi:hypothetical protein